MHTMQSDDGTTWVEIANTANSDEAELIQGFLEAEGIESQVEHAEAHMLPTNVGQLGDVRVYVPAADTDRARALLQERDQEFEKLKDDDDTVVTDDGVAELDESVSTEKE
jgi:Putative prokaryotic signal transducing protein